MTQNQIAYLQAINQREANAEIKRNNQATLAETQRSNLAREAETQRYNTLNLAETQRANLAREQLQLLGLQQTQAQIQESKRSNLAREAISREQNAISLERVNNEYLLGTSNLFETSRMNTANIGLTEARIDNTAADTTKKLAETVNTTRDTQLIGERIISERSSRKLNTVSTYSNIFGFGSTKLAGAMSGKGIVGTAVRLFGGA